MPKKKKSTQKRSRASTSGESYGEAKFPYANSPSSLGKFLQLAAEKPRPPKVNTARLQAWGFRGGNDSSIIRVLKAIDFLTPTGEPTKNYEDYMRPGGGGALGRQLKKTYAELFSTVGNPQGASYDELKSFFNTFGGGSERMVQLQIQTFKNMATHATFGALDPLEPENSGETDLTAGTKSAASPAIRIDLHIHLPENKTKADYDSILEGIAKHLYGKKL